METQGLNPLGQDVCAPMPATPGIQDVRIIKAENGFVVLVGCKQFVSQSWSEVALGLELYFQDPQKAQERFCSKK